MHHFRHSPVNGIIETLEQVRLSTYPTFPQEIIDLIIDELASLCRDSLKACSLVSRTLNLATRRHIFFYLFFSLNKNSRRRANGLLKLLNDGTILRSVRYFHLTCSRPISQHSFRRWNVGEVLNIRSRISGTAHLQLGGHDTIYNVFRVLSCAPLTDFTFSGRPFPSNPNPQDKHFLSNLLQICSNPALSSIHITTVSGQPEALIKNVFYSPGLKKLKLSEQDIDFSGISKPHPREHPFRRYDGSNNNAQRSLAALESLFLMNDFPYKGLLSVLLSLKTDDPTSSDVTPTYFPTFPHLQRLGVTRFPSLSDMNSLWKIMLGVSPYVMYLTVFSTVDALEFPWPRSTCLSYFQALVSLTFFIDDTIKPSANPNWECAMVDLLLSASTPMALRTVKIGLSIEFDSVQEYHDFFFPGNSWRKLDNALNKGMFVLIDTVICNVTPQYTFEEPTPPIVDVASLFPRTASTCAVDLILNLTDDFEADCQMEFS